MLQHDLEFWTAHTSSSIVLAPTVLIRCRASCRMKTTKRREGMAARVEAFVAWGSLSACPGVDGGGATLCHNLQSE